MQKQFGRYIVKDDIHGIRVDMQQGRNARNVLTVCILVASAAYFFSPYGPRPAIDKTGFMIVEGFMAFMAILSVAGMFYKETCLITKDRVSWRNNAIRKQNVIQEKVSKLGLFYRHSEPRGMNLFRWRVYLLNESGKMMGGEFQFESERQARDFIKDLQFRMPLEVVEKEGLYENPFK